MRRSTRLPARITRTSEGGSTLFPFLAVLLCTMGSLIVLLVVIGHQGRASAAQRMAAKSAELEEKVVDEIEMSGWRVEQLKQSRDKTAAQLTEMRLHLSHLEDHIRRLREKQSGLFDEWEKLKGYDASQASRKEALEGQLSALKAKIAAAEERVKGERRRLREARSAFAIVPYEGENGTTRRPIYVECRADAVVLQPLGIEFNAADFNEPIEPGNPLDAALRAIREYWVMHDGFDPDTGEPYPLILVRPHGEIAYNLVRAAINSWGSEFGYELIEDDWELRFPPAEPGLDQVVTRAIDEARRRQRQLAKEAPRVYRHDGGTEFTVSPVRGGLVPIGESGSGMGISRREQMRRSGGFERGSGAGRGAGGDDRLTSGSSGRYPTGGSEAKGAGAQEAYRDLDAVLGGGSGGRSSDGLGRYGSTAGTPADVSRTSGGGTFATPGEPGGNMNGPAEGLDGAGGGFAERGSYSPGVEGAGGGARPGGTGMGTMAEGGEGPAGGEAGAAAGSIAGSPDGSEAGTAMPGQGGAACPTGAEPGNASTPSLTMNLSPSEATQSSGTPSEMPEGFIAGRSRSGDTRTAAEGGQVPGPGEYVPSANPNEAGSRGTPKQPSLADVHHRNFRKKPTLAESRGEDWGLPEAMPGSLPITRPIRVECYQDQILLRTERRGEPSRSVPLSGETRDATDAFVTEIWRRMDSWGIAGRGMYWRPILHVYTAPGAEKRADDLEALLEGSGLEVKRK